MREAATILPLTEAKRSPRLNTMHAELVRGGLKPQVSASSDGPNFEFGTEEEAKRAAEILMQAGYAIRANNRQGKVYRVSASWAKDLSEKPDPQKESVRGTVLEFLHG